MSHEVWIPIGHVISLFARESGEGMGFEVEALETEENRHADRRTLPMRKMQAKKPMCAQSKPVRKAMAINRKKA